MNDVAASVCEGTQGLAQQLSQCCSAASEMGVLVKGPALTSSAGLLNIMHVQVCQYPAECRWSREGR